MSFLIGLIGLSLMVLIHELGHFLVARLFGVEVLKFSIGMGPKIYGKKIGKTEYLISALPLGGYCQMKGEEDFMKALEKKSKQIDGTPGSLYGISSWKRLLIAFAGPFFNLVSAFLLFFIINLSGFTIETTDNRIVLVSDFTQPTQDSLQEYPAQKAGLKTGDRIIAIDGEKTEYFYQILEKTALSANKELIFTIERQGEELSIPITPQLNPQTGGGVIGVYSYQPLRLKEVQIGSLPYEAGLRKGDTIRAINGRTVFHAVELQQEIFKAQGKVEVQWEREGNLHSSLMYIDLQKKQPFGFSLETILVQSPPLSFGRALKNALKEPFEIIGQQVKSFAILNQVDMNSALQGPIRITSMIGDSVLYSFQLSLKDGFIYTFRIIAVISVILFFMNLLPIPALDGGLILISFIEFVTRRQLPPKALSIYQTVGVMIIILLTILVLSNEAIYFLRQ